MQAEITWSDLSDAAKHFEVLRRPSQGLARLSIENDSLLVDAFEDDRLVTTQMSVAAAADGEAVVPIKQLADFIRVSTADSAKLSTDNGFLSVEAGPGRLLLRCVEQEVFVARDHCNGPGVEWSDEVLAVISRVVHAASSDTARPLLTGVQIRDGWAVATDSFRLAAAAAPTPPGTDVVVPGDVLRAVLRATEHGCIVRTNPSEITFEFGGTQVTTSLILGAYPDWRAAINEEGDVLVRLHREDLIAALHRLAVLVAKDRLGTIRLEPNLDHVILRIVVADLGEQDDIVAGSCSADSVSFGYRYLLDLAEACRAEWIELRARGPLAWFTTNEDGFVATVCPIRS